MVLSTMPVANDDDEDDFEKAFVLEKVLVVRLGMEWKKRWGNGFVMVIIMAERFHRRERQITT